MNSSKLIRLTPYVLIFTNLILKLLYIAANSIGGDEPFSIYHAQMDVGSIIFHLTQGNNPPFYEILLHFWIKVFGISEWSVRMPSVLFSSIAVFFIFKIGERFFNFKVGLTAGLLFTFSNFNLQLAHEARVYALFSLLTAASMYYFLNFLRNYKQNRYVFMIVVLNLMLIYSHYFGFFVIAIQTLSVLLFKNNRIEILKRYGIYLLMLFVLYIPNLTVIITRVTDFTVNGTWLSPPSGLGHAYYMLKVFSNQPLTAVICISILLMALIKFLVNRGEDNPYSKVLVIWFVFPFTFMFAISFWFPMFFDRYLIFVSSGFYLTIALLANTISQIRIVKYILSGIVVLMFVFSFKPNIDNNRHVRETVAKVNALKDSNTSVIICPSYFMHNFTYYYNKNIFKDVDCETVNDKMVSNLKKENIHISNSSDIVAEITTEKIIYLDAAADFSFPGNNILTELTKNHQLLNTYKFHEIFTLYEFQK